MTKLLAHRANQQAQDERALTAAVAADQAKRAKAAPKLLQRYYRNLNKREDADPQMRRNREDARKAHEAMQTARAAGESLEVQIERAERACGRDNLNFDDTQRHEQLRHEVFREVFRPERGRHQRETAPAIVRRAESSGTPRSASSTRSSVRSGDSGDDSDLEPEPPSRRFCAFCNKPIPAERAPQALYCKDGHAALDRQRRKRQRDRERDFRPAVPTTADFMRMREITAEDVERLRELVVCRCNGHHLELEPGWCSKCGHWLPHEVAGGIRLYEAFMARLAAHEQNGRVA